MIVYTWDSRILVEQDLIIVWLCYYFYIIKEEIEQEQWVETLFFEKKWVETLVQQDQNNK